MVNIHVFPNIENGGAFVLAPSLSSIAAASGGRGLRGLGPGASEQRGFSNEGVGAPALSRVRDLLRCQRGKI